MPLQICSESRRYSSVTRLGFRVLLSVQGVATHFGIWGLLAFLAFLFRFVEH